MTGHALRPRAAVTALAALILSACAGAETRTAATPPAGWVQDVSPRVAAADWNKARTVTVRMDEYSYAPETLALERGVPTRLRIENAGAKPHTYTATGFFKTIAVRRLTTPQGSVETPALLDIEVPARQTAEVEFIPLQSGTYELICDEPLHDVFGMTGKIAVK